jgi:hypothetical protein
MLSRILRRLRSLLMQGTRVEGVPRAVAAMATEGDCKLDDYLELDDIVLWSAISAWRHAPDRVLSDLSSRLQARHLFKTYELYAERAKSPAREEALEIARDVARSAGLDPEVYVGLDCASDLPFDDRDGSLSVIFPSGEPKMPGDVSYLLGRLRGEQLERVRLIFAPELRQDIVRAIGG